MNPVLINDLRKSLFRRKPVLAVAYMAAAILVLTYGVFMLIPLGPNMSLRDYPVWRFPDLMLPILAPAFTAGAFAKEHEQRTWQDVLMTRLRASEILSGKFFACLLPTLVMLIVLFPPFAMLMIVVGVSWAFDPGPWMIILGAKFLLSAAFYIAVGLACSYHSPNPRMALAITYIALAACAMLNYLFWFVAGPFLLSATSPYTYGSGYYSPYSASYNWSNSRDRFALTPVDWLLLLQFFFLSAGLLAYLAARVRWRKE